MGKNNDQEKINIVVYFFSALKHYRIRIIEKCGHYYSIQQINDINKVFTSYIVENIKQE
jgi:hypothetical protein